MPLARSKPSLPAGLRPLLFSHAPLILKRTPRQRRRVGQRPSSRPDFWAPPLSHWLLLAPAHQHVQSQASRFSSAFFPSPLRAKPPFFFVNTFGLSRLPSGPSANPLRPGKNRGSAAGAQKDRRCTGKGGRGPAGSLPPQPRCPPSAGSRSSTVDWPRSWPNSVGEMERTGRARRACAGSRTLPFRVTGQ